jgi:polar amino acid transport system substrate-binding protein
VNTNITYLLSFILYFSPSLPLANDTYNHLPILTGEWPPYASESMTGYGLQVEIVSAVFKEMGEDPHYRFLPWPRGEYELSQGEAFASFPYAYTEKRALNFNFSDVIFITDSVLFFYKGNLKKFSYQILEDLKDYRIAGVLGYTHEHKFRNAGLHKISLVRLDEQLIPMLGKGNVDLVVMDRVNGWLEIKKHFANKIDQFGTLDRPFSNASESRLMISRDYPNHELLRIRFNEALKKIKNNGKYKAIVSRYLKEYRQ